MSSIGSTQNNGNFIRPENTETPQASPAAQPTPAPASDRIEGARVAPIGQSTQGPRIIDGLAMPTSRPARGRPSAPTASSNTDSLPSTWEWNATHQESRWGRPVRGIIDALSWRLELPAGQVQAVIAGDDPRFEGLRSALQNDPSAMAYLQRLTDVQSNFRFNGRSALANVAEEDRGLPLFPRGSADTNLDMFKALEGTPYRSLIAIGSYFPAIHENEFWKGNAGHAALMVPTGDPNNPDGGISVDHPQTYDVAGNTSSYGVIALARVKYPAELSNAEIEAYEMNGITMTALANTFIPFTQENFNGQDPLGAITLDYVQEAYRNLMRAVLFDKEAMKWLGEVNNQIYCAEMVNLGQNLKISTPLTEGFFRSQFDDAAHPERRDALKAAIDANNAHYPNGTDHIDVPNDANGRPDYVTAAWSAIADRIASKRFLSGSFAHSGNSNRALRDVEMGIVEGIELKPLAERVPHADKSGTGLATQYWTFPDIIATTLQDHFDRTSHLSVGSGERMQGRIKAYNAASALAQVQALEKAVDKYAQLNRLNAEQKTQLRGFLDQRVIPTIATLYDSPASAKATMDQLITEARAVFGRVGPNGEGAFVPPNYFWAGEGNLLDYEVVGAAVPSSWVRSERS